MGATFRWSLILQLITHALSRPPIELEHRPTERWLPNVINGSVLPDKDTESPDFRRPEPPFVPYWNAGMRYIEGNRPYRISPHHKQAYLWSRSHYMFKGPNKDNPYNLGCYCTTVYKRLTPLAGCAVLTLRHILTTASSTELVIKDRRNDKTLTNILGAWYDVSDDRFNSSMYMTPVRIHYHPRYHRVENVNISHPLPMLFDLAVWASMENFWSSACYCGRANSGYWYYGSSHPKWSDVIIVVGFQYIKSLGRKPMPWFKYAVRTKNWVGQCPKTEWGWFHCLYAKEWGKYGIESGAAWHRATHGVSWLQDGLAGLAAFSLHLRSARIVTYFTVINTHVTLEFLYDAYMGKFQYEYLDQRFHDNKWRAPVGKSWYYIKEYHPWGEEKYKGYGLPYA